MEPAASSTASPSAAASSATPTIGSRDDAPSALDARRRELLARVDGLGPVRAWPEALALAALAALLAAVVLGWGAHATAPPRWLGETSSFGGVLALLAVVAVLVPSVMTVPHSRPGLAWLLCLSGVVAPFAAGPVRTADGIPLPPITPGRMAVWAAGALLLVAGIGMHLRSGARSGFAGVRERAEASRSVDDRDDGDPVGRAIETLHARRRQTSVWLAVALVVLGAGALLLVVPWWHGDFEVPPPTSGSVWPSGELRPIMRSGVELAGGGWAWAIAAIVVVVVVVAIVAGRRRGPVVAAVGAGAVTGALAAVALAVEPFRFLVAVVAAVTTGMAAVIALVAVASTHRRVVAVGTAVASLVVAVGAGQADPNPIPPLATEGPYTVLASAHPGGVQPPIRTASDGEMPMVLDGEPAATTPALTLSPVWWDGEPAVIGYPMRGAGVGSPPVWRIEDGMIRVQRTIAPPPDLELVNPGASIAAAADLDVVGGTVRTGSRVIDDITTGGGEGAGYSASTVDWAALGLDGRVWMRSRDERPDDGLEDEDSGEEYGPLLVVVPGDEAAGHAVVDASVAMEVPPDIWDPSITPGRDGVFAVSFGNDGADPATAVFLDTEGAVVPVLGGAPSECGLTSSALASSVTGMGLLLSAAHDGGLWAAMPSREVEVDHGVEVISRLVRVGPDGNVRVVDHELTDVSRIVPSADDSSVMLVAGEDALLLPDVEAALEEPPPPSEACAAAAAGGER